MSGSFTGPFVFKLIRPGLDPTHDMNSNCIVSSLVISEPGCPCVELDLIQQPWSLAQMWCNIISATEKPKECEVGVESVCVNDVHYCSFQWQLLDNWRCIILQFCHWSLFGQDNIWIGSYYPQVWPSLGHLVICSLGFWCLKQILEDEREADRWKSAVSIKSQM